MSCNSFAFLQKRLPIACRRPEQRHRVCRHPVHHDALTYGMDLITQLREEGEKHTGSRQIYEDLVEGVEKFLVALIDQVGGEDENIWTREELLGQGHYSDPSPLFRQTAMRVHPCDIGLRPQIRIAALDLPCMYTLRFPLPVF